MTSPFAAYQRTQNAAEDPRNIEYRLLGQVTAALMDADRQPEDAPKLVDAALWNRQVWAAFKVDLMGEGNRLPEALRGKLLSLALWVERETSQILSYKSDLSSVIGVNRIIMDGLRPKVEETRRSGNTAFEASAA